MASQKKSVVKGLLALPAQKKHKKETETSTKLGSSHRSSGRFENTKVSLTQKNILMKEIKQSYHIMSIRSRGLSRECPQSLGSRIKRDKG